VLLEEGRASRLPDFWVDPRLDQSRFHFSSGWFRFRFVRPLLSDVSFHDSITEQDNPSSRRTRSPSAFRFSLRARVRLVFTLARISFFSVLAGRVAFLLR
jgi:hypothetical protein